MGESRVQMLASHPHSSSWQLFSLLWSVLIPCGPSAESHGGMVTFYIYEIEDNELNIKIVLFRGRETFSYMSQQGQQLFQ